MRCPPIFFLFCVTFAVGVDSFLIEHFECRLPSALQKEISGYKNFVDLVIKEATAGKYTGKFFADLATFVDKFGNRLTGTKNLENAIDYIANNTAKKGLAVHKEPLKVPYWVRGKESAELLSPRKKDLKILGLGFSPGTSPAGITADVIVVSNFEELEKKKKEIPGKIVLFNAPYTTYGETVVYRTRGPAKASSFGAAAALVRSVTPFSIYSPHTGTTRYGDEKKIPAACVTLEDADMMARMYKAGEKVTVNLKMEAKSEPDQTSHNLIFDLPGTSPNQYVTVSGHIDSWDVGQGALDDGVGAFLALHSVLFLKSLNVPQPKRTVRGIMWTAEELGLLGAFAYAEKHKDELKNWTAALESDAGLYKPLGLSFNGTEDAYCVVKEILSLFKNLNATTVKKNPYVGSDIDVFRPFGVPLMDPLDAGSNYMWFHHTDGDSMRTQNSDDMDKNLALFAATSYILANLSIPLPRQGQTVWDLVSFRMTKSNAGGLKAETYRITNTAAENRVEIVDYCLKTCYRTSLISYQRRM